MPLPHHCNSSRLARDALVLGPSAALNRDPTPVTSVNNTSQTVPQHLNLHTGVNRVDSSKNKASLWRWQRELLPFNKSKWVLFGKWCRENLVDFSTTLLKLSHNQVFHRNPQHLNLHAWCLGVGSSKNKASLWKWQRELLPLKGHQ